MNAGGVAKERTDRWPCCCAGGVAKERLTTVAVLSPPVVLLIERMKTVGRVVVAGGVAKERERTGGRVDCRWCCLRAQKNRWPC